MRIRHGSSHDFGWQSSHSVDLAGWQAKWLPLKFGYHDIMRRSPILIHWHALKEVHMPAADRFLIQVSHSVNNIIKNTRNYTTLTNCKITVLGRSLASSNAAALIFRLSV